MLNTIQISLIFIGTFKKLFLLKMAFCRKFFLKIPQIENENGRKEKMDSLLNPVLY